MVNIADLFSNLNYNNLAQISQNPASTVRTPRQEAYDNLLNAQAQAQNTTRDEWGQAIGNSINGLGKIIASSVVSDPFQKAGAMKGLEQADARQDQLVRDWANARAKKRQDFVQQAKEQLGLAIEDEDKAIERDWRQKQDAYKRVLDDRNQANIDREFENKKTQQDFENKITTQKLNLQKTELQAKLSEMRENNSPEAKAIKGQIEELERRIKEANAIKIERENKTIEEENEQIMKYAQQDFNNGDIDERDLNFALANPQGYKQATEEKKKQFQTKVKEVQTLLDTYNKEGSINPDDYIYLRNLASTNPDGAIEKLQSSGKYTPPKSFLNTIPIVNWLVEDTKGNPNKFKAVIPKEEDMKKEDIGIEKGL